jgi:hypothetical protein
MRPKLIGGFGKQRLSEERPITLAGMADDYGIAASATGAPI